MISVRRRAGLGAGLWALLSVLAGGAEAPARGQTGVVAASSVDEANAVCQACHAVPNLSVFDPRTDRMVILTVDPVEYRRSVHSDLSCNQCHPHGYARLPHSGPLSYPRFLCVSCHQEAGDLPHLSLEERRDELLGSVHGHTAERDFDCHTCHDPHRFWLVRDEGAARERIRASNRLCLDCHGAVAKRKPGFEDLAVSARTHGLFPNPRDHFRKIKCVSCHTGEGHTRDHDVLAADRSIRECSECHSQNSPRFEDSYAAPGSPDIDGPAEQAQEDVYVIGSTRSEGLDRIGLGLLALVLALTTAHSLARQIRKGPR